MPHARGDLDDAISALEQFSGSGGLTDRISHLEQDLRGADRDSVVRSLGQGAIDQRTLVGALALKRLVGQINTVVHAVGIVLALPVILEPGEKVVELSLGAGNTGRPFDLVTDRRVAEFTFIRWRGGAETIRQNKLFVDLFHLAEANTPKRRELYVTNLVHTEKFLRSRRALKGVLHREAVAKEFFSLYGQTRFKVTADYWNHVRDRIKLIDVTSLVPALAAEATEGNTPAG